MGDTQQAAAEWRALLEQTHVDEADYSTWARRLAEIYIRLGRKLASARIYEYLRDVDRALDPSRHDGGRDCDRQACGDDCL